MQVQFNGLTPLGTNLDKKVIQPFLGAGINGRNLAKPILVRAAHRAQRHAVLYSSMPLHDACEKQSHPTSNPGC